MYQFSVWWNSNLLRNSQWITFPPISRTCSVLSMLVWCIHLLFHSSRVLHTNVRWWSFTGVWQTTSLFRSPGLFSVFLLISIIMWSGQFLVVLRFQILPVFFLNLWRPFRVHQSQLVSLSISCSTVFSGQV